MLVPLLLSAILAQSQDVTLSLASLDSSNTKPGLAFGANYAHRIVRRGPMALSAQLDFLASPNRKSTVVSPTASRDVASLYVIPGMRLSFLPERRFSPFVAGGLGLAAYEESALLQNGAAYPGSRTRNEFAASIGGGVDMKVYRWAGLRFEVKSYQKNIMAGIGLHFQWGK